MTKEELNYSIKLTTRAVVDMVTLANTATRSANEFGGPQTDELEELATLAKDARDAMDAVRNQLFKLER